MKRVSLILGLSLLFACDKDKEATEPPVVDAPSTDGPATEPEVPQEPDPPEIAEAAHAYLLGNYQEVIDKLEPLFQDLEQRQQWRASGLAGGWLALAHAQIVFENAEGPSQHALAMAEKTGDREVKAVAQLAHGAFLMGNEDFTAAQQAFDAAAGAAPETAAGALANILRAESLIGRAFGSGASDKVQNPADLESAKKAYEQAAKTAQSGVENDLILGRVEEGLAAIAKYQGNRDEVCTHAVASVQHYKAAGVSQFLLDGPARLASDHKCELPEG